MLQTIDLVLKEWGKEKTKNRLEQIGEMHLRRYDTIRPHFELMNYAIVELFKLEIR